MKSNLGGNFIAKYKHDKYKDKKYIFFLFSLGNKMTQVMCEKQMTLDILFPNEKEKKLYFY